MNSQAMGAPTLLSAMLLKTVMKSWRRMYVSSQAMSRYLCNGRGRVTPWWRHMMETISASLIFCEGNPPMAGGSPSQKASNAELWFYLLWPLMTSYLNKQPSWRWFETPRCSHDVRLMTTFWCNNCIITPCNSCVTFEKMVLLLFTTMSLLRHESFYYLLSSQSRLVQAMAWSRFFSSAPESSPASLSLPKAKFHSSWSPSAMAVQYTGKRRLGGMLVGKEDTKLTHNIMIWTKFSTWYICRDISNIILWWLCYILFI